MMETVGWSVSLFNHKRMGQIETKQKGMLLCGIPFFLIILHQ